MAEFDYSQYENGDGYATVDAIRDMLRQADNTSRPMSILLECYNRYEKYTSEANAIANDKEALDWLDDYWEYVCSVEHGNQASIEEIGGFKGMIEYITDPEIASDVIDYLQYDDEIDDEAKNLIDRLKQITSRYNGVNKMKFTDETIGDIQFREGYTDSERALDEILLNGKKLQSSYDAGWDYHYYLYNDRIIGVQWQNNVYVGCWIADEGDLMERGKDKYRELMKMKKSVNDIPNQFYINLEGGGVLTFVKEEYPMGVRWLCSDDYRFYSDDGSTVIFPCMQTCDDGRMLFLFEEEDWADDYDGEYSNATGYDAINEFEDYINDILSSGVYIDYGDEDIMESTKKMKKSEYEDGNVPASSNDYRNGLESIMDLPQVGAVYTNSTGGSCRIIAVDEPALSEEYRLDNFQITYQMGHGDIVCHKWKGVKNMLEYNGYDYKASTKKSTPSIHDMIAQTRANNNSLVKSRVDLGIKKQSWKDNYKSLPEEFTIKIKGFPCVFNLNLDDSEYTRGEGAWYDSNDVGCVLTVKAYDELNTDEIEVDDGNGNIETLPGITSMNDAVERFENWIASLRY